MFSFKQPSARYGETSMEYDAGLRAYMLKVFGLMAAALAFTGGVSLFIASQPALMQSLFASPMRYVVMFAPLGVVMFLSMRIFKLSTAAAKAWFWTYAGLVGLSLAPIFYVYTGVSVARVFFISSASFGVLALYGYTTKKDLSGFGSFLIMGLFGVLIAGLVNIFLKSEALHFTISAVGVLVFAGLTAYDMQRIKESYYMIARAGKAAENMAVMGALQLYVDFIALFVNLLSLFGEKR
ncbi:MAG: Bax inhibitor-1/YccA family protein [Rickettsiales bacterium]